MSDRIYVANSLDHPVYVLVTLNQEWLVADMFSAAVTMAIPGMGVTLFRTIGELLVVMKALKTARQIYSAVRLDERLAMFLKGGTVINPGAVVAVNEYNRDNPMNYLGVSGWANLFGAATMTISIIDAVTGSSVTLDSPVGAGWLVEERGVRSGGSPSIWTSGGGLHIWDGGAVDTGIGVDDGSGYYPNLVSFNGSLHAYFFNNLSHAELKNGRWSLDDPSSAGLQVSAAPSVVQYRNRLYCLYRGDGGSDLCYATSDDGSHFTAQSPSTVGWNILGAPSAAVLGDRLCVIGSDIGGQTLRCATFDGTGWRTGDTGMPGGANPCMVVFNNQLHAFFRGPNSPGFGGTYRDQGPTFNPGFPEIIFQLLPGDAGLYHAVSSDGLSWSRATPFQVAGTSVGPSAVVAEGVLFLFLRDPNGNGVVCMRSDDGQIFKPIQDWYFGLEVDYGLSTAYHGGMVYVVGTAPGGSNMVEATPENTYLGVGAPPAPVLVGWTQSLPLANSTAWVAGCSVRYRAAYLHADGQILRGPWWNVAGADGDGYVTPSQSCPQLTLTCDPTGSSVARIIYREFRGMPEQAVWRIPDSVTTNYIDDDTGPPPAPTTGIWYGNLPEDGTPLAGSVVWKKPLSVRYSVAYEYADGTLARGPWWPKPNDLEGYFDDPNFGYAFPLLEGIACDPTGRAVARRVYRQFHGWPEQMIRRIPDNTETSFGDVDIGPPPQPGLSTWTLGPPPLANSGVWVGGYKVRYAVAYEQADGTLVRSKWWSPATNDGVADAEGYVTGWTCASLNNVACDPQGKAVARRIIRQFYGWGEQVVGRIADNTTTTFGDGDLGPPPAPGLVSWGAGLPVAASGTWVPGFRVRYSVAYELADGTLLRGPWWSPNNQGVADADGFVSAGYAYASLDNIQRDPGGRAIARRIYRQFHGWPEQMVGRIPNNVDTTFGDGDPGPPAAPGLVCWGANLAGIASRVWQPGCQVRYATAYEFGDGSVLRGPWWSPNNNQGVADANGFVSPGYACASLDNIAVDPTNRAKGRRIYREIRGWPEQVVGHLGDNTATTFGDGDLGPPPAPGLDSWSRPLSSMAPVSAAWVPGFRVRYSVGYELPDGTITRGPWWSPNNNQGTADGNGFVGNSGFACANLTNVARDPSGRAIARRIYRQFHGWSEQMVGRITDPNATTFGDGDAGPPPAPGLDSWAANLSSTWSATWVPGGKVRYAVAYEYSDGSIVRGPWWSPNNNQGTADSKGFITFGYACANLTNIACAPTKNVIARRIYRQFYRSAEQMVARISNNTATTFRDVDPGPPPNYVSVPGQKAIFDWSRSWPLPEAGRALVTFALNNNDSHIAFWSQRPNISPRYDIVVGGWNNTKSAILRRPDNTLVATSATGLLHPGAANQLWITLDRDTGRILVGRGTVVGQDVILSWFDAAFLAEVQSLTFSTWDLPIQYSSVTLTALPRFTPIKWGNAAVGAQGALVGSTPRRTSVALPAGFDHAPHVVLATARGIDAPDTFSASTSGVSPTSSMVNVMRGDAVGWGQNLGVSLVAADYITRPSLQTGSFDVGSGGGFKQQAFTFPRPFNQVPRIFLTARGADAGESFAVTSLLVSATGFTANVRRVDVPGAWTQDLHLDWLAFTPDGLADLLAPQADQGLATVGAGGTGVTRVPVTFTRSFSSPPTVLLTPQGQGYNDTFAVTASNITPTGFTANLYRVDASGSGWSQNLLLNWLALA